MGGLAALILHGLSGAVNGQTFLGRLILVAGAGSTGLAIYLGLCALLRVREIGLLFGIAARRLRGS
jgi:hypothetical protein